MHGAGKAVFCEKPVSQVESGIRACYELAEKVNKPLFCSFNRYNDISNTHSSRCLFLFVCSVFSGCFVLCDTLNDIDDLAGLVTWAFMVF